MPFTATWLDLDMIILSEISQVEKYKYHIYRLYVKSKKRKIQMN